MTRTCLQGMWACLVVSLAHITTSWLRVMEKICLIIKLLTTFEYIPTYTSFNSFLSDIFKENLLLLFQITRQHIVMNWQKSWIVWNLYSLFIFFPPQDLRQIVLAKMVFLLLDPFVALWFCTQGLQIHSLCFRSPISSSCVRTYHTPFQWAIDFGQGKEAVLYRSTKPTKTTTTII